MDYVGKRLRNAENEQGRTEGRRLRSFAVLSALLLFLASFLAGDPLGIPEGLRRIAVSRDALITDYFALAGCSAAYFNAGLIMAGTAALIAVLKVPFSGLTMAALFINAGYGLWGKHPLNMLPILLGSLLYARRHKRSMSHYIYTGLFATCLSPLVTETVYLLPFPRPVNLACAAAAGILIGFVLPPLSMHTASMHMGYSLYNVGFAGGIFAFVTVCVLGAFGLESSSVLVWREGGDAAAAVCLFLFFGGTALYGLWLCGGRLDSLRRLIRRPGRVVTDFVLMDGAGAALMNMSAVGALCTAYILLIGGDMSGPVVGSILMAFGFGAFGASLRNYPPVLAGVFIAAQLTRLSPTQPGLQLAAIAAVGLAPIAGQFGAAAGVLAGMLQAAVAVGTVETYGGLNLYNSGFSAGLVAIVAVPLMESFQKHYGRRKTG